MMAQGPVVWHQVAIDPIHLQSTRITNQPEQEAPIDVPQFKFKREPLLPSDYFWQFPGCFWS